TPHPGPLPVEGRGGAAAQAARAIDPPTAASRPPSPLNGERAGVRGANGPLRSTPLAALTPSSQILVAFDIPVRSNLRRTVALRFARPLARSTFAADRNVRAPLPFFGRR